MIGKDFLSCGCIGDALQKPLPVRGLNLCLNNQRSPDVKSDGVVFQDKPGAEQGVCTRSV